MAQIASISTKIFDDKYELMRQFLEVCMSMFLQVTKLNNLNKDDGKIFSFKPLSLIKLLIKFCCHFKIEFSLYNRQEARGNVIFLNY